MGAVDEPWLALVADPSVSAVRTEERIFPWQAGFLDSLGE